MSQLENTPLKAAINRIRGGAAILMLGLAGQIDLRQSAVVAWSALTGAAMPDAIVDQAFELIPVMYMMRHGPDSPLNVSKEFLDVIGEIQRITFQEALNVMVQSREELDAILAEVDAEE